MQSPDGYVVAEVIMFPIKKRMFEVCLENWRKHDRVGGN